MPTTIEYTIKEKDLLMDVQRLMSTAKQQLKCLSVIVPVYNEAFLIRQVLKKIQEVPFPKEIIIVDDCSTDGTREILKAHESGKSPLIDSDKNTLIKIFYQ